MKIKIGLLRSVLFILTCSLVSCARVDEQMIMSAKMLAMKIYNEQTSFGFGALHPILITINKIEVIDIGKKNNNQLPVKLHIEGIIKTQEDRSDASSFPIRLYTVDVTKPINDTVVYYFSKDEFNKQVVCAEGGFQCINERDIKQYQAMLENMEKQYALAKNQDAQRQAEYAQQQKEEEVQRQALQRKQTLRVVSTIIGKYPTCVDRWNSERPGKGTAILTDVNTSYLHIYPNEQPYQFEVVFWFDNIKAIKKNVGPLGCGVNFDVKERVEMRPGDTAWEIGFSDQAICTEYFNKLSQAKAAWDRKYPEFR